MNAVNINKLKGKIVENGLTVATLAQKIGMDATTLYRKLNNNGETLLIREVFAICDALQLSPSDAISIFLPQVSH